MCVTSVKEKKVNSKVMEKVSFYKFFPNNQNFVVASGEARSPSDFWLSLDFGDGIEKASFSFNDWNQKASLDLLKSMQRAIQEALDFYDKVLNLPPVPNQKPIKISDFFGKVKTEEKKPVAKKAVAKKPAAKKAKAKAKAKA